MGKIAFSKHAIFQMQERNLSEKEIMMAILDPDKIVRESFQKFQALKIIERKGKRYLLVVVLRNENSSKKIITAFLTSKIKKYLY